MAHRINAETNLEQEGWDCDCDACLMLNEPEAFEAGKKAFKAGLPRTANPFDKEDSDDVSWNGVAWAAGWQSLD